MKRWMGIVVLAGVLAGCLTPNQVVCDDGRVCPGGTACDQTHGLCVAPTQLTVCSGLDEGAPCTVETTDDSLCDQGVCLPKHCGDNHRTDNEQCDGPDVPADANCNKLGFYFSGTPTCNDACSYDTSSCKGYCGDGMVTPGIEVCDTGTPIEGTCVDFGFGAGNLACAACVADTRPCISFGWTLESHSAYPENIVGTATDDLWLLSGADATYQQSILQHFDGTSWSTVDLSSCGLAGDEAFGQMVTPSKGVLFVAGTTTVIRLMGTTCTKWANAANGMSALWAASATDARVVSGQGVSHFDGTSWSLEVPTMGGLPDDGYATSLYGTSSSDVWVAFVPMTGSPYLRHFDGTNWSSPIDPGLTSQSFGPIWGTSSTDIYVAGGGNIARWNGTSWSWFMKDFGLFAGGSAYVSQAIKTPDGKTYALMSFNGPTGARTFLMLHDGTGWGSMVSELAPTSRIFAASDGFVLGLRSSSNQIARFSGNDRIDMIPGVGVYNEQVLIAAGTDDAYAGDFGNYGFYHWDGGTWKAETGVDSPADVTYAPDGSAISVSYYSGVWIKPPRGTTWTNYTNGTHGYHVSALATDDLWIAGINKLIHWQSGTTSTDIAHPGAFMATTGVWAASDTNVFMIGSDFNSPTYDVIIAHYDGTALTDMTVPAGVTNLQKIWGRSATDVFALGNGTLIHYDGTSWKVVDLGKPVRSVWGPPNDMFVTTAEGIEHFDGTQWSPIDTGTAQIGYAAITGVGNWIYALDSVGGFHRYVRLKPW